MKNTYDYVPNSSNDYTYNEDLNRPPSSKILCGVSLYV